MNYTDLFQKNLKEASAIICKMSEEEVNALQEAVFHMDHSFQSQYARLLVFRKDSLRLLSLLNDGESELCYNCVKYLKIRAIRKDLMSKLTDESAFIELFNRSCELGKDILLECLVWNKDRPANCLADRLYKNPNFVLNSKQSALLKNAQSIDACLEENSFGRKKYYKLRTRDIEKAALHKLHMLYCTFTKEKEDETRKKCDDLMCYVHHLTTTITVGDERLMAMDIILNLICALNSTMVNAQSFLDAFSSSMVTMDALHPSTSETYRPARKSFTSLSNAFKTIVRMAPIYVMKRINFMAGYKLITSFYNDFSTQELLSLIQSASLLGEKDILDFLMSELGRPCHLNCEHDLVSDGDLDLIENVLTKEQFAVFLNKLAENTITELRRFSKSSSIVYTPLTSVVPYLSHHLPGDDERLLTILDLFFDFESQYLTRSSKEMIHFYGLQIKEVPCNFSYQMGTRDMMAGCKTARKFESVLCLKGNTFLNTRDPSDRMTALKEVVSIAGRSHDVRSLSRCLMMYTRTELKFADVTMDLTPFRTCFSPDSLGLSPMSLHMSGSAEEAAAARNAIVNALCEWGQGKKGNEMVQPLMFVIHCLYLYATMYPEHEAVYCAMMKPLVELLTNSNMDWSSRTISLSFSALKYRTEGAVAVHTADLRARCLQDSEQVQNYVKFERFCSKQLPYVNSHKPIAGSCVVLPTVSFPNPNYAMPALAKGPLVMIIKLTNEETLVTSLLCSILSALLNSTCSTAVYKENQVELCTEKIDGKPVKRHTQTTTPSPDMKVIKELMDDNSFSIKAQFEGVSPFNSLQFISSSIRDFVSNLHFTVFKNITYSIVEPSPEKKEMDMFERLLNDKNAMMAYLKSHGSKSIDSEMSAALDQKMKEYTQKMMSVVHVDMSLSGLRSLLSNTAVSLNFSIDSCKNISLEKLLPLISNETLLKLQKLASLYVYIFFQIAVLAVSLNKSDRPILDGFITRNLSTLQFKFFEMLQALMLINNACTYRSIPKDSETGMKKEVYMLSVKALAPFVVTWLNAVKDKATQTIKELKNEDAFKMEEATETVVTLDFSDNDVVGRFVEIIFYSRFVKDYFGKSLGGAVRLISRMNINTALIICRRFLLISSFVPLAESIITNLLRRALSDSAITDSIMTMMTDSSTSITVALIGLLFRLAANPLLKSKHAKMLELITTFTNYIIKNNFKSEDVYVILLRWAINKILYPSDVPFDFLQQLLSRLTVMKIQDDAGKTVFSVFLLCALYDTECPRLLHKHISTISGASSRFSSEMGEMFERAEKENVDRLKALMFQLIPQFTITDEAMLSRQIAVLCVVKHTEGCDALTATCEKVVREMWRPYQNRGLFVNVAALFLFLKKGVEGVKQYEAGLSLFTKLQQMKNVDEIVSKLPEFSALGISQEDADIIDHNSLDTGMRSSLISCQYVGQKQIFEFLASLDAPDDFLLPFKVYAQAVLKALKSPEEFAYLEDAKLDMRTLVAALDKVEMWMVEQLSQQKHILCSFSDDCVRELSTLAKEQITNTICWLVILTERNNNILQKDAVTCTLFIENNQQRELYFII